MDFGYYNQQPIWNGQSVNVDARSFCQTLTEEEMNSLKQAQDEFTLGITKEDQLRAICMHRDINGHSMLEPSDNGLSNLAKCKICGESFRIVDSCSDEDIKNAVDNLVDILQTTKTLYVDMPSDAAKKFYTILALLKKVPGLYKVSVENFAKHENAMANWSYNRGSAVGEYNMLYAGYNPAMQQNYGMPAYMGAYMGQPQAPVMGQPMPAANQGNPFGYGQAPVAGYQPMMQGYAYQPQAPVAPQAPAPAAPAAAPAEGEVKVDTAFQA